MYASGGNYRIALEDGVVHWTVWARPDVDSQQGARFAEEQISHSVNLAIGASRGLFFDLSGAPNVMGPRTTAAIEATLAPWERIKKPVAILIGDNAMQRLQWERIVREQASHVGRVFASRPLALAWAASKLSGVAS